MYMYVNKRVELAQRGIGLYKIDAVFIIINVIYFILLLLLALFFRSTCVFGSLLL